jgi:hypothetical protein
MLDPCEHCEEEADTVDDPAFRVPICSKYHGSTVVAVTVGAKSKWEKKTFTIHKDLLCRSSDYFKKAVDGPFIENARGELELPVDCPMVFELFYQWLYTGEYFEHKLYFDGTEALSSELFWYEVYKFAECRLLPAIQETAYNKLRWHFCDGFFRIPSVDFVECLFGLDSGAIFLQKYVVAHTAYWIHGGSFERDWERLEKLFDASASTFGAQVALRLSKLCCKKFGSAVADDSDSSHPGEDNTVHDHLLLQNGDCSHPSECYAFDDYRSFGSSYPPENVRLLCNYEGQVMPDLKDQYNMGQEEVFEEYKEEVGQAGSMRGPKEDEPDGQNSD